MQKKLYLQLSKLTSSKCHECPAKEPFRCCDAFFCKQVEAELIKKGLNPPKPNIWGIPYMGKKGCVLSPELRPLCTGFVCTLYEGRKFSREYDRLANKLGLPALRSFDMSKVMDMLK